MIVLTGTVSITNGQTTLTGSGTEFIGSVFAGDAISVDRKTWYRVEADATSDTALSFSPAFGEATVSGATLYLMPVSESRLTDIGWSAGVTALRQRYRSVLNIAGADKTLTLDKAAATNTAAVVLSQSGTPVAQIGVSGDNLLAAFEYINGGTPTILWKTIANGVEPSQTLTLSIPSTQGSSSATTGALVVAGGVGVGGALNVAGAVSIGGTLTGIGSAPLLIDKLKFDTTGPESSFISRVTIKIQGVEIESGIGFKAVSDTGNFSPLLFENAAGIAVGVIQTNASSTQYLSLSDERHKMMFDEDGIDWGERIDRLWVGGYKLKSAGADGPWYLGIRAQQAYGIAPQGITPPETENGAWMADFGSALGPLAMWGVKELRRRVAAIEARLEAMGQGE